MEIRRLSIEEFYELRDLLDGVFSRKYGNETRFQQLFPRFFTAPNHYATHSHFGAFENGKLVGTAALYPLDYVVDGEHIRLIGNGNVAVHEDFRGQGIMSALLRKVNEACDHTTDMGYLHGDPVRYGRFGFFGSGTQYALCFQPQKTERFTFLPMEESDAHFLQILSEGRIDYIKRKIEDFIPALSSGGREALSVLDKNYKLLGYISLNRATCFVEEFAFAEKREAEIFAALASLLSSSVTVRLSGYDIKTLSRLRDFAQVSTSQPALFRITNPKRIASVLKALQLPSDALYAPYLT